MYILFRILWAFWICKSMFFTQFGKFFIFISSIKKFFLKTSFALLFFQGSNLCTLGLLPRRSLGSSSWLSFSSLIFFSLWSSDWILFVALFWSSLTLLHLQPADCYAYLPNYSLFLLLRSTVFSFIMIITVFKPLFVNPNIWIKSGSVPVDWLFSWE